MMTDRVIFVCTIIIAAVYFYATTLIPVARDRRPAGPQGVSAPARRSAC